MKGRAAQRGGIRRVGLVDGLGVGAWQLDVGAGRLDWSPELRELYGMAPATEPAATLEAFFAFVHPADRARARAVVDETLATRRESHEHRFRIVRPDGGVRQVLSRARLARDGQGEPATLTGVVIDLEGATAGPAPREQEPEDHRSQPAIGGGSLDGLWAEIEGRFGVCPSFFKLAQGDPPIARMLWRLAEFAYLDFPAPSLFKEQLFTCLSRFCRVRYCVARHTGFLMGFGHAAGDPAAAPLAAEQVLALLDQPAPDPSELPDVLAALEAEPAPLAAWPGLDSDFGRRFRIACEAVFLDPTGARPWIAALHRLLGAGRHEQLMLFLTFVRIANLWTEMHPEIEFEADVQRLVEEHETLARILQTGVEASAFGAVARVREDTAALLEYQKIADQLRLITDSLPALVAQIDSDQRYTFANAPYCDNWGLPRSAIIGRQVRELLGEDNYRQVRPALEAALGGQGAQRRELSLRTADPDDVGVKQVTYVPHQGADGSISGCTVLVVDLSEQKASEAALKDSLARYRQLAEAMPQLVWTADARGRVDYYNRRLGDYDAGVGGEDFDWRRFVHPDESEATLAAWHKAFDQGTVYAFEHRLRMADGSWRWHLTRAVPSGDEAGKAVFWYGTATDIHDLKMAERAQHEQLGQLEAIYQTAPLGLALFDRELRFVRVNEALAAMNGLPVEAHLGRSVWEILPSLEEQAKPLLQRVFETGEPITRIELAGATPDAPDVTRHWVEQFYPIKAVDGTVTHVGVVCEEVTERRNAEEALRESERRFRVTFENAAVGMAHVAPDGRWLRVNQRLCQIVGYTAEELLEVRFQDITHPDDLPADLARHQRMLSGELDRHAVHKRYLRQDGSTVWINLTVGCARTCDGAIDYFISAVEDISDYKRAEQALRESEEQRRLAIEAARLGTFTWDAATGCYDFDARSQELLGIASEAAEPLSYTALRDRFIHPEDRSLLDEAVAQASESTSSGQYELEYRVLPADGSLRWLLSRGRVDFGSDRRGRRARRRAGVLMDITERKVAEQTLRESEARFREMADNAPMMVWVSDTTGACIFLSRSWYEFTGQQLRAGVGFGWLDVVHPEDRAATRDSFLAAVREHAPFRLDYRLRRADGEYRWAIDAAAPRLGESGEFLGYIGSVIDISERKEAEDRQALLMREVDHRARNALAVVQSVVRLTRADNPADFVATVEGRIGAIAYAHTLLAESGWTRASLRSLLKRELAAHPPGRVRLSGEDIVLLPESAQPFALAIHELVTNAAKYGALSSPSGFLEVTWAHDTATAGVRVRWRESGGPPVQPPARAGFGSTLIATALEQQLGGTVRQEWEPAGLVCDLIIPLERLRGTPPAPEASQPASEAPRVLVIEDDMLIALDVEQLLTELGYQVTGPVGRLAQALQTIEREPLDAVVLDADLAGESAAPVAIRLRALGIPFVVATGYGNVDDFGDVDPGLVLTKPIAAQDLRRALNAALAGDDA